MNRFLRTAPGIFLLGLFLTEFNQTNFQSSTAASTRKLGYGLIVGKVAPCSAKVFDASSSSPLIVILTKDAKTYDTYNVTADHGTIWYHFDVKAGHYQLTSTWPTTKEYSIWVHGGMTSTVNVRVSCGPSSE